jgi:ribonuclease T1
MRRIVIALLLVASAAAGIARDTRSLARLIPDAGERAQVVATLQLIAHDGPFPFPRDGIVFGNHEHRLPNAPRGFYREYTVPTPGVRSRGARRIIRGNGGELYYTRDHYRTFVRIDGAR